MGVLLFVCLARTPSCSNFAANGDGTLGGGWARVDERAPLPIGTVMLGSMELLTELGLVVLGDVHAL